MTAQLHRRPPTPIWLSRRASTALLALAVLAGGLLLYFAPSVVALTLGGLTLAIVFSFPVRMLSRVMPQWLAILLSLLCALALAGLFLVVLIPVLLQQLEALVKALPEIVGRLEARMPRVLDWLARHDLLPSGREAFVEDVHARFLKTLQEFTGWALSSLGYLVTTAVTMALMLLGIVFVGVYMLADSRQFRAAALRALPHRYRWDALELWDAFGTTISRYLGGLGVSITVQGVLSAVALYLLGVPYALLLGTWVAIAALIPYVGAWLSGIPAVAIALSVSPTTAVLTAILFLLIQQLEGNFLTPRIQSQAVRVHPLVIFLVVIAFGEIFGLVGIVFAVPALAVARVLYDFFSARLRVRETVVRPTEVVVRDRRMLPPAS